MADYLRNFIAGAAETGQKLYAEKAVMDRRAEIQTSRDTRLAAVQATRDKTNQAFQTQRDTDQNAFTLKRDEVAAGVRSEETAATATYRADQISLDKLKLRLEKDKGETPTANMKDAEAMVTSGYAKDSKEAWAMIQGDESKLLVPMLKILSAEQEFLSPGMAGYLPPEELLGKAKTLVGGLSGRNDPASDPNAIPVGTNTVLKPTPEGATNTVAKLDSDINQDPRAIEIQERVAAGELTKQEAAKELQAMGYSL